MTRFSQVTAALRRKSLGQYALLTLCCFVSVLLITAYASMMGSPTVLSVFPEGGDSRKQMTMIFVLAVLGCGVFLCPGRPAGHPAGLVHLAGVPAPAGGLRGDGPGL